MPSNTVKVDRSSKWGNPFIVGKHGNRLECVRSHSMLVAGSAITVVAEPSMDDQLAYRKHVREHIQELRGKNLACWCPQSATCHADILLKLANLPL